MKNALLLFRGIIKRRPMRLIMTALCAAYCFFSYFGLSAAAATLTYAEESFVSACGRSDIIVSCEDVGGDELSDMLAKTPGVGGFTLAYRYDTSGDCADGVRRTVRLTGIEPDGFIKPVLEGGSRNGGGFYISSGYAADFGVENVGRITLSNGETVEPDGIFRLPDFTSVYVDRFTVSTNGDIVDIYADIDTVRAVSGDDDVNTAYVNVAPGADIKATADLIRENGDIFVDYAIPYDDEPSYSSSTRLFGIVLNVCDLFPTVLFGTGIGFIFIFLSGVAARSAKTVKVLLADGAGVPTIAFGFFLAAFASVFAGLLLSLPASYMLADDVAGVTAGNMGITYSGVVMPASVIANGVLLSLGVSLASCAVCVVTVMRDASGRHRRRMRKKASAAADVFISFLCSAAAISLILVTCMYRDSVDAVREEAFFERCRYDAEVIYSDFVPLTELSELEALSPGIKAEPVIIGGAEFRFGGRSCRVSGIGLAEDAELMRFTDRSGERIYPVKNRVILSPAAADALGAGIGDMIEAEVTYGERRIDILCLVSDISEQHSMFTEVIPIDTVTEYLDSSGVMNGVLVSFEGADAEAVSDFFAKAKNLDGVYAVQSRAGAVSRFDGRYEGVRRLTMLIIVDGAMLGAFIFLLMGYGTWRRGLRKNSILIMLGESPAKIALCDLAKCFAGAFAGAAAGIPFSIFAEGRILARLSTESTVYPLAVRAGTLSLGVCAVFVCAAVTAAAYTVATGRRAKDIL